MTGPKPGVKRPKGMVPPPLPCATDESGPLCDRAAAVADVAKRFGAEVAETEGQLLPQCGNGKPIPGNTQPATTRYRAR